jgi:LacI family transcriptional regulator
MLKERILLKDIALKTGLTINTVSRALQDKNDISLSTKQMVKEVANALGYIPNVIARSMRSGFTNTIGIVFDNIANPYYMIMTELLHRYLEIENYDVFIITTSGDNSLFDQTTLNKILSRKIDGIISFLKPNLQTAELIKANRIPIVIVGREGDDLLLDSIYTNDVDGGYQVGKFLHKQGFKHIGYIGAPKDILCSVKRLEGLKIFLEETKPSILLDSIFLSHGDMELKNKVDFLIKKGVDAIFCFNDVMAMETLTHIQQEPHYKDKNIQIVGYDHIAKRLNIPMQLTSIDSDKEVICKLATQTVIHRIKNYQLPLVKHIQPIFLVE